MPKLFRRQAAAAAFAAATLAIAAPIAAQNAPRNGPIPDDVYDKMIPKHPGMLGALAPDNLQKPRPKPPFNLTGTWFVDLRAGFLNFMFGPPYPKFKPEAQKAFDAAKAAQKAGKTYRDSIGQCYPPGMPMIMTRVWPHAFIQLPTAIYMISGFNNSVRTIFLDGRDFTDPDLVVPSYNGESIGHWEGDTLVVKTKYFETDNHWIDTGLPISDDFQIIERIKLLDDGKVMEIKYIMTDPQNWEGEWTSTKHFLREDYTDVNESHCILQYNENLPGTELGKETTDKRGQTTLPANETKEDGGE